LQPGDDLKKKPPGSRRRDEKENKNF